ncbi:restriction endonuclease [Periweissella cryptocerci]|uniref:Restriction endonuclease n=1 Tax=Periweissella cryptocerci TaxID=2506420 RepID=A0A4V1AIY1_9LACO|nr:restriction endonuclease [Periweissella cryptocerci]QBO37085.1 restriction endonuclease [Periweissella cryptocerci]
MKNPQCCIPEHTISVIDEDILLALLERPHYGDHPGFNAYCKALISYARVTGQISSTGPADAVVSDLLPAMVKYLRQRQTGCLTSEQVFNHLAGFLNTKVARIKTPPDHQLKEHLLQMPPHQFEVFTRELMHALGLELDLTLGVKQSADGGIDGFGYLRTIYLRTERIAIQAKRWQSNIGSREIDSFRGAMDKFHADFGIFITTSRFTKEAVAASRAGVKPITLVDGDELVGLVRACGVQVISSVDN